MLALSACQPVSTVANSPAAEAKQTTWETPLDGAASAALTIRSLVSAVRIAPLDTGSPLLVHAELGYIGELTTAASGAEARTVTIADQLPAYSYNGPPLAFTIGLNRQSAVQLNVSSGSGAVELGLGAFTLGRLDVSAASGSITADLPAAPAPYPVTARTASGDMQLTLANGAAVQFESVSTASGDIQITAGGGELSGAQVQSSSGDIRLYFTSALTASFRINTSSGDITVTAPASLPVRLQVVSNARGAVTVPARMTQTQGAGNTGVWQTASFPESGPRLDITVTSTASGDVTIQ